MLIDMKLKQRTLYTRAASVNWLRKIYFRPSSCICRLLLYNDLSMIWNSANWFVTNGPMPLNNDHVWHKYRQLSKSNLCRLIDENCFTFNLMHFQQKAFINVSFWIFACWGCFSTPPPPTQWIARLKKC